MNLRCVLPILMVLASQAIAAGQPTGPDPKGDWLVSDGTAVIHIAACTDAPALCGTVAWTKYPAGTDDNNPDPEKRKRSVLGLPILLAMKPASEGRWEGEVYNSENGKTYQSRIWLKSADVLRIEGCVFGFLCGGEDWTRTRLETPAPATTPPATPKKLDTPAQATSPATPKKQEPAPKSK